MARIPAEKPKTKKINLRSLIYAAAGPEPDYPVYQFSKGRKKMERPNRNPFRGQGE